MIHLNDGTPLLPYVRRRKKHYARHQVMLVLSLDVRFISGRTSHYISHYGSFGTYLPMEVTHYGNSDF